MPSVATPALLDSLLGNSCQPQADRSSELSISRLLLFLDAVQVLPASVVLLKSFVGDQAFHTVLLPCFSMDIII